MMYAAILCLLAAELLLSEASPARRAISTPPAPPANDAASPGSFDDFANIHLSSPTEPPPGSSIGFHIQLGYTTLVDAGQDIQLSNYSGLKKGLFAVGPLSFEAFNGSFCPPVTGYYHLATIIHLTVTSVGVEPCDTAEGQTELQVTVSVCLTGLCNDSDTASLEAVSSASGNQTLCVSGLLHLTIDDTVALHISTNDVTMATVMEHSSFMAFRLG